MQLSILMPARNEMFLARTVQDLLANIRADTEIIVVCDGAWADPPVPEDPRVTVIYLPEAIGQRAATNLAARASQATYVMKLDAHCAVAEGFDAELIAAAEALGPDVTQIPAMYNLHAFNWKCLGCGNETYQGPTPTACRVCAAKGSAGGPFERVIYWDRMAGGVPGKHVRTEFWRFDDELHFQYWASYRDRQESQGDIVDVMSSLGACFFMRRDRFWALGGLDEAHGSWGQFGTEIACKSWLSGGRHVVNKRTWFAHLFRTQGGDFGMPYPNPESKVRIAREYSRRLWIEGTWPGAVRPLAWLIEKFSPVPSWSDEQAKGLDAGRCERTDGMLSPRGDRPRTVAQPERVDPIRNGLAYYTDNRGDEQVLRIVRQQIRRAAPALPIAAVPLNHFLHPGFPDPVVPVLPIKAERGYLSMFRQQLAAIEALETDIVFMVEHDVLYHPSHFEFIPPRRDRFYYNQNTWRVDAETGRALFYYCNQVSGLCAYRDLLLEHYRKRVAHVEAHGFDRNLGFEPGANRRVRELDPHGAETWMSPFPNVDIKTKFCLTKGRWRQDEFRNKNSCLGWQESDAVPGWGVTRGRFAAFLADVSAGIIETKEMAV